MAIGIADLLIRVKSDTAGAVGSLNALGMGLTGLGVGAAAASVAMVKMGMDAQSQLSIVAGLTGASKSQMDQYTAGLQKMAGELGSSMAEGAKGLYYVVSAGFQGAAALNVLNYATMAAKASGADLKDVADGLTSAMNAYQAKASEAGKYTDIMTTAVTYGKQTFGELAAAVGQGALIAASAHIPFTQLAAAESSLTDKGVNASMAMNSLRMLITKIGLDTGATGAAVKKLGGHFDATAYNALDLMGKLSYLRNETGLNETEFIKLIGGARSAQAALGLLSDGGAQYRLTLSKMTGQGEMTAAAFKVHDATLAAGFEDVKASLSVLALQFVTAITPKLVDFLQDLATKLQGLPGTVKAVSDDIGVWSGRVHEVTDYIGSHAALFDTFKVTLLGIGAALLTIKTIQVASAIVSLVSGLPAAIAGFAGLDFELLAAATAADFALPALWSTVAAILGIDAASGIWILAILAVIAAITGIILVIKNWSEITKFLGQIWKDVSTFLIGVWDAIKQKAGDVFGWIGTFIGGIFNGIGTKIHTVLGDVGTFIGNAFNGIGTIIHDVLTTIMGWVMWEWDGLVLAFSGPLHAVATIVSDIFNIIYGVIRDVLTIIVDLFKIEWQIIVDLARFTWTAIQVTITTVWNFISGVIQAVWTFISGWIKAGWAAFTTLVHDVWTPIQNFLGGVWNTISAAIQTAWNFISKWVASAWTGFTTVVHNVWTPIQQFIGGVWDGISNGIKAAWNSISSWLTQTWAAFSTTVNKVWTGIGNAITGVWSDIQKGVVMGINGLISILDGAINAFNSFVDAIVGALSGLDKALGGGGFKNPPPIATIALIGQSSGGGGGGGGHMSMHAGGTENDPGGWAWVGELGRELMWVPPGSTIIPHTKSETMAANLPGYAGGLGGLLGGVGNIVNTVTGGIGGFLGDIGNLVGHGAKWLVDHAISAAGVNTDKIVGLLKNVGGDTLGKLKNDVVGTIGSLIDSFGGSGGFGGTIKPGSAGNMSEFIGGYNGDCGETAELMALHVLKGRALTATALDQIVHRDQGLGWAGANGVISIGAIGQDLKRFENVKSTYYSGAAWKSTLEQYAGNKPIIFLYSNAGGGLPGDEKGVHWHFNTALGKIDSTHFLFGDGDNSLASTGKLNVYTLANLQNASPQGEQVVGMAEGGWINEPISGIGASGTRYRFGERGPEYVSPGGSGKTFHFENHFHASMDSEIINKVMAEQEWQARLHGG